MEGWNDEEQRAPEGRGHVEGNRPVSPRLSPSQWDCQRQSASVVHFVPEGVFRYQQISDLQEESLYVHESKQYKRRAGKV